MQGMKRRTIRKTVPGMDKKWNRRGREILAAATSAARKGEPEASKWLMCPSLEVRMVAQMAGMSTHGLARLVESVQASAHADHLGRFASFDFQQRPQWR